MRKHTRPSPQRCTDEQGTPIARVPVDARGDKWATLDARDFDRIIADGLSLTWHLNSDGKRRSYVKAHSRTASGGLVTVARVIMGAGPGEIVAYLTGDRLDLRQRNLIVERGKAKRTDAGYCERHDGLAGSAIQQRTDHHHPKETAASC
ncbi:hypothetical protein [Jiella sonneratiae]|uniref:Transposase n=1 Tax=Jiella sonneratiae TaxID=2816856 RepID=A0ABS3J4R0_9HYPH|nr:hypothetical protein [Jiella sonneratiae]MBO0904668.1 hypothetical protein [Jiella sonneratiae]